MTRKPYEINGLSLVVYESDDRENAIGYLTRAERFLAAAEKLIRGEKSFIPAVDDPESLLAWHALELLLKSFLLACGEPPPHVRKLRHDLRGCLKEAEGKGICKIAPVSPTLREAVDLISDEYSGKHFEYFLGSGGAVRSNLRQLLQEIRKVYETLEDVYRDALKTHR